MFKNVEIEIRKAVSELLNAGFESGTFLDRTSEYHEEAYEEVVYTVIENISEEVLDQANSQIDRTDTGNLIYKILSDGINEKLEYIVRNYIETMYFQGE